MPERHFHAFGGLSPNPSVTAAALAAVTERVRIRSGSVVVPLHHPARIAEFIAEVKGVHFVPIAFETDGKRGSLMVGSVGNSAWQPIEGQNGGTVTVQGQPLAISPGNPVVVGRASRARFQDHGIDFDASGRQAMVAPYAYSGPSQ